MDEHDFKSLIAFLLLILIIIIIGSFLTIINLNIEEGVLYERLIECHCVKKDKNKK